MAKKFEKKVPHPKSKFDENKWVHQHFIRLEPSTFSCDTEDVQHKRYIVKFQYIFVCDVLAQRTPMDIDSRHAKFK